MNVKVTDRVKPPDVAVTVTEELVTCELEPEIMPESRAIVNPSGRPLAVKESDEPRLSTAVSGTETDVLVNTVVVPGFVSVMVSEVTRTVANTTAVAPVDSVMAMVAVKVPVCVGLPAITPVVAPMDTPAGRPSAT